MIDHAHVSWHLIDKPMISGLVCSAHEICTSICLRSKAW
jgi:hypothetical protein